MQISTSTDASSQFVRTTLALRFVDWPYFVDWLRTSIGRLAHKESLAMPLSAHPALVSDPRGLTLGKLQQLALPTATLGTNSGVWWRRAPRDTRVPQGAPLRGARPRRLQVLQKPSAIRRFLVSHTYQTCVSPDTLSSCMVVSWRALIVARSFASLTDGPPPAQGYLRGRPERE